MALHRDILARLPEVVIGTLAGRLGGPAAVGAFQAGMRQRQMYEAAAERQAALDAESRRQQEVQEARQAALDAESQRRYEQQQLDKALTRLLEHAKEVGGVAEGPEEAQAAVTRFGQAIAPFYDVPEERLRAVVPALPLRASVAEGARTDAQAVLDQIIKANKDLAGFSPEHIEAVTVSWTGLPPRLQRALVAMGASEGQDVPATQLATLAQMPTVRVPQPVPPRIAPNVPLDRQLAAAEAAGDTALADQIERAMRRAAAAQRAPMVPPQTAVAPQAVQSDRELATLVAGQPAMAQGLTASDRGRAMRIIASDPILRARYETTRMAPLRASAERIRAVIGDLLRPNPTTGEWELTPGARALYGVGPGRLARYYPGSAAANAKAALDQLTGNLTLNMLAEAKSQSRTGATGFGQLSHRELDVVESAATVLKGEISEARARQELVHLLTAANKILAPGPWEGGSVTIPREPGAPVKAAPTAAQSPGEWIDLGNGIQIRELR